MTIKRRSEFSLKDLNEGKGKCSFINYKPLNVIYNICASTCTLVIGGQTLSNFSFPSIFHNIEGNQENQVQTNSLISLMFVVKLEKC